MSHARPCRLEARREAELLEESFKASRHSRRASRPAEDPVAAAEQYEDYSYPEQDQPQPARARRQSVGERFRQNQSVACSRCLAPAELVTHSQRRFGRRWLLIRSAVRLRRLSPGAARQATESTQAAHCARQSSTYRSLVNVSRAREPVASHASAATPSRQLPRTFGLSARARASAAGRWTAHAQVGHEGRS